MALTQRAFDLLLVHLDPDRKQAAAKYEMTRKKLIKFFEWQHCYNADACADETIDRVANKLDSGTEVRDLGKYFNGVARLIALEVFRERETEARVIRKMIRPINPGADADKEDPSRLHCMQECLSKLSRKTLELVVSYYQPGNKKGNRMRIAQEMNIQLNALRLRVHKIRRKLRKCYVQCLPNEKE
jgi:DNA-directed RNA polymerase specialized sigma24 family protein